MTNTRDLQLYYRPSCPYCVKVLRWMDGAGVELPLHDISHEEERRYLVEHGGKQQVPCLFIDDEALYESDDIIAWMARELV